MQNSNNSTDNNNNINNTINNKINQFDVEDKIYVCHDCENLIIPIGKDICEGMFCFNDTATMYAKYCHKCSKKKNRCYICGTSLNQNPKLFDKILDILTF